MGITAGASLLGAAGTSTAIGISASTMTWVGVGLTVAGALTGNQTMAKVGAGMGLGASAMSLYNGLGGAATEAKVGESAAGTAARESAGKTAESSAIAKALAGADAPTTRAIVSGLADAGKVADISKTGLINELGGVGNDATLGLTAGDTFAPTIFGDAAPPASYWDKVSAWWGHLEPNEKLAAGRVGAGLIGGVGKGVSDYMQQSRTLDFQNAQIQRRERNLSGVPSFGLGAQQ